MASYADITTTTLRKIILGWIKTTTTSRLFLWKSSLFHTTVRENVFATTTTEKVLVSSSCVTPGLTYWSGVTLLKTSRWRYRMMVPIRPPPPCTQVSGWCKTTLTEAVSGVARPLDPRGSHPTTRREMATYRGRPFPVTPKVGRRPGAQQMGKSPSCTTARGVVLIRAFAFWHKAVSLLWRKRG